MLSIGKLTLDYKTNPLGIDNRLPAFSWQLNADRRGEYQTAYRILVAESMESLDREEGDCWDSGIIESDQSQHVIYGGSKLVSRKRYYWKVKVWNHNGEASKWSDTAHWEMGLLDEEEWSSAWITAPFAQDPNPEPDLLRGVQVIWDSKKDQGVENAKRYFRFTLSIDEQLPVAAKLQVFAADSLCIYVNEHFEGLYYPYLQTVTLDITPNLRVGPNVIACSSDGEVQGFIAVLQLTHADGREELHTTDAGWKVFGSTVHDEGFSAEWMKNDYSDNHWRATASIGLFGEGDWSVYKRILYPVNTAHGPCPKFRRGFQVNKPVRRARLYISALGIYQSYLNGQKIGNDVFTPGWTDYRKRIPYQTYDVTPLLGEGDNRIEVIVGSGWYAGHLGIVGPYHYGKKLACRAELHIEYKDGESQIILTDENWETAESPVVSADIYMGETYDARREIAPLEWKRSALMEVQLGRMQAQQGPPIQPTMELVPQSVTRIGESLQVIDMGQNMVGWLRLHVSGPPGTRITMRYGEKLTADGRVYRLNLRTAKQTDTYILRGDGSESYEPSFTFHGFQYVEIEGYPGELSVDQVRGIVVHSAAEEVSEIETSHTLLNRLLENIKWSQRGNFFGVPLDCPQRDERLGWTGDAHAFARTATYNMNSADFYQKWLIDIRDAQGDDGAFPDIAPFVEHFGRGHVFFAEGGVILPWTLYRVYGDRRIIEDHYEAMVQWINWLIRDSDEHYVRRTMSFGDHLSFGSETPRELMNAAFFAYSVQLMTRMAEVLGKSDDQAQYQELFGKLKRSFIERFVGSDARIECESQTAYVLALMIGLLPEGMETQALQHLVDNIREHDWHLTTGFMGVSYVLPILAKYGEFDTAYRLLLQESFPSWLYPVLNGATTIWERWDGWSEEKGYQDPEMNSFNHYALGSVGEWVYRYVAGIDLADEVPGFQSFRIHPRPGGGIDYVRCRYESLYGSIESEWKRDEDRFTLSIEVPANCKAEVRLPAWNAASILIDGIPISQADPVHHTENQDWTLVNRDQQAVYVQVASGRYNFEVMNG